MVDVLTVIALSAPWFAMVALACRRGGLRLLLHGDGQAFPSQADRLRGFGAR
jgi:hypothetical protein